MNPIELLSEVFKLLFNLSNLFLELLCPSGDVLSGKEGDFRLLVLKLLLKAALLLHQLLFDIVSLLLEFELRSFND